MRPAIRVLAAFAVIAFAIAPATAVPTLFASPAAAGEAAADPFLPPEIERVVRRGRLVVAVNTGLGLPLCAKGEDGLPHGLEPDLARDMAKSLGVDVEFVTAPTTPEDALTLVRERRADMAMAGLTMTAERSLATPFGDHYITLRSALVVSNRAVSDEEGFVDAAGVVTKLGRSGARIGVGAASYHRELAAELFPGARTTSVPGGWENLLAELLAGRVDAVLSDELQCVRALRQAPELTVYYSAYILRDREEYIAAAFHWRDHSLIVWHNAWLRQKYGDPYTMGEIMQDYRDAFAAGAGSGRDGR